jgi:hypothetical protein
MEQVLDGAERNELQGRTDVHRSTKAATPDITVGTHSFNQLYLYAFATQGELLNHVRTQTLDEEFERFPEILFQWQMLQLRVQQLCQREHTLADQSTFEDPPTEFTTKLKNISGDPLFAKTFSALPTSFSIVEIDKLVAAQRSVNLDYVGRLIARFRDKKSLSDLIDHCVSPVREMPPIQHLEIANNAHVFSSPNLDVRFLGAFLKRLTSEDFQFAQMGGLPAAAIIAFVGYGGAPINVLRWGNRLVLNNGFHRVYALRSLGVTKIPVVVQHVNNLQLEFPQVVSGFPREYLLRVPRPVLMKDFFEDGFCITLKAKDRIKTVTLQTSCSQFDIPS